MVAKPQVSAGSQDTVRLKPGDPLDGAPRGPALLQPFLPAVAQEGEQSLFYFNGVLSHAVAKAATGGDFRVQPQFGGQVAAMTPSAVPALVFSFGGLTLHCLMPPLNGFFGCGFCGLTGGGT